MWTFIFDIGGVLLDFDLPELARIAGRGDTHAGEGLLRLREHDSLREIESGSITGEEYFARHILPEIPHWTFRDLIEGWKTVFTENDAGLSLLRFVRERGACVCFLSNIADFNKVAIEERFPGFFQLSDRNFLSCDMGCIKPEPEIFRRVLRETGAKPERCVFLDDNAGNVAAARELGMHGFVFENKRCAEIQASWIRLLESR
jgi:putative hydrolase of the HAD superfamily